MLSTTRTRTTSSSMTKVLHAGARITHSGCPSPPKVPLVTPQSLPKPTSIHFMSASAWAVAGASKARVVDEVWEGLHFTAHAKEGSRLSAILSTSLPLTPVPDVGPRISRGLLLLPPAVRWLGGIRRWPLAGRTALSGAGSVATHASVFAITSNRTARRRPTLTQPRVTGFPGTPGAPCHTRIEHEDEDGTTSVAQIHVTKRIQVNKWDDMFTSA